MTYVGCSWRDSENLVLDAPTGVGPDARNRQALLPPPSYDTFEPSWDGQLTGLSRSPAALILNLRSTGSEVGSDRMRGQAAHLGLVWAGLARLVAVRHCCTAPTPPHRPDLCTMIFSGRAILSGDTCFNNAHEAPAYRLARMAAWASPRGPGGTRPHRR
jgi:hypothetical protein